MSEATLLSYAGKLTREQLALVPTPLGTVTHRPIPHIEVVNAPWSAKTRYGFRIL